MKYRIMPNEKIMKSSNNSNCLGIISGHVGIERRIFCMSLDIFVCFVAQHVAIRNNFCYDKGTKGDVVIRFYNRSKEVHYV